LAHHVYGSAFLLQKRLGYHSWFYLQHLNAKLTMLNKVIFNNKLIFKNFIFNNSYLNIFEIIIFGFDITNYDSDMSIFSKNILISAQV